MALVGYTNAGKSTLFNALTRRAARSARPAIRHARSDHPPFAARPGREVFLVDTVGFVRDLPHELVAAFRATLTETREAALLLHVIDASDPHHAGSRAASRAVLEEIGAAEVPAIRVYNKIDRPGPAR